MTELLGEFGAFTGPFDPEERIGWLRDEYVSGAISVERLEAGIWHALTQDLPLAFAPLDIQDFQIFGEVFEPCRRA